MSEAREQVALAQALDRARLLWCHVPNGGRRDERTARLMRASGVKSGVPDVLIFTPPPRLVSARGVALELKAGKGDLGPEQREWLGALGALGWVTVVAWGVDSAVEQLKALGYVL